VLNRIGLGCEISPAYCDVALRRIANLTGEEPILVETGQTMTEVAAERGVPMALGANPRRRAGTPHPVQRAGAVLWDQTEGGVNQ
jgi:hypothetical protein